MNSRLVLALSAVLAMAPIAFAQTGTGNTQQEQGHGQHAPRMMDAEQRLERLSKRLELTDDQKAKIKPILEDEQKQMQAIHSDTATSRQDKMAKMKALRQNTISQIRSLLTADQQKKLDDIQAKQQARMEQRMANHQNPGSTTTPQQ